jgi:phenylalanyl-tRNA synthetase beta chain
MIVSYKWLQSYFKEKLPVPAKVAEAFTFGAFEVEGFDDASFDLKVLPDRACYALSHRGIAYELAAITGQKTIKNVSVEKVAEDAIEKVSVTVMDKTLCRRYCARYIKNVEVEASPVWLRERLTAVGQRAINTIVDATNFVMLDMGQPLHAFDADKVHGGIVVRLAKAGETIELLPEKGVGAPRNISLQETDLVIADDAGPIAIAGVKGGFRAAVTQTTQNLIIESANFDPVSVRKTSTRLALRNDASKRFENNLLVDFAPIAMAEVSVLIKTLCPNAFVGPVTDIFAKSMERAAIAVSSDFISERLGIRLSAKELEEILTRLQIVFEKKSGKKEGNDACVYTLAIPSARLDLNIPEDIVEEVGRIYGYEKITPAIPQKVVKPNPVNHFAYWVEKIKDVLFGLGFSEVQTSSFATQGEVEIQNPLASDKKFARSKLYEGFADSLERNAKNAALFGSDEIKIFEIGTVFSQKGEYFALGLGVTITKNVKKKEQAVAAIVDKAFQKIGEAVGRKIEMPKLSGGVMAVGEINLSEIIATLPEPADWKVKSFSGNIKYLPFSVYPFMVRDVAVFVPSNVSEKEVSTVIDSTGGPLMLRFDLFDVFTKKFESGEEKTSYAFRLVFQSRERTLVEEEVNAIMKKVSYALTAKNWQVR